MKDQTVEILTNVQHNLAKAWVAGDREFIEATLADDWVVTDLTGRILTKEAVLREAFASDDREVVSMSIDDICVRPFETFAIVTGRTHAAGRYKGEVMEVSLRFTDVFADRDGKWQAIASQATLIS